jgi:hypothetical protein
MLLWVLIFTFSIANGGPANQDLVKSMIFKSKDECVRMVDELKANKPEHIVDLVVSCTKVNHKEKAGV